MAYIADRVPIISEYDVTIENQYFLHEEESQRLMVLLPGVGYTVEQPLLYYLQQIGLQHQYDVLAVEYGFQAARTRLEISKIPIVREESEAAVARALQRRRYTELCIVGKSLGTPIAVSLPAAVQVERLSFILLTPIQQAASMTGSHPALAVIGTADSHYRPEDTRDTATLHWHVLDGLDHSLERPGQWQASLQALTQIMQRCEQFLMSSR